MDKLLRSWLHENGNDRDWRASKDKAQNYYLETVESTEETAVGIAEAWRIYPAADTTKVSSMGITKDNGQFNLSLDRTGKYLLKVVSIGRQPLQKEFVVTSSTTSVDLGTLTVSNDDKMLGEITVTAVRPVVTKEIDRIGYDVQADDESKTSTLEEMLRKVPLVSVDTDGTITVKGSSDFKIYKNGRPNNSFTKNAKDIFKAIPRFDD